MSTRGSATIYINLDGSKCWICGKEPAAMVSETQKSGGCMRCYIALLKLGWRPKAESPDKYVAQLRAKRTQQRGRGR